MLRNIAQAIIDYYHFVILPFLSIFIFYAMEYMNHGSDFFVNEKGVKWRFLSACALMQFFVSLVVIIPVIAIFRSDTLREYETFRMIAIILLGITPFNISILILVAIKLEIYRLMKNRYKDDLKDFENTKSLLSETLNNNYEENTQDAQTQNQSGESNAINKIDSTIPTQPTQTQNTQKDITQDKKSFKTKTNKKELHE